MEPKKHNEGVLHYYSQLTTSRGWVGGGGGGGIFFRVQLAGIVGWVELLFLGGGGGGGANFFFYIF